MELADRWVAHARDHEDLFRDHEVGLLKAIVRGAEDESQLREMLKQLESTTSEYLCALDFELMGIEGGDEDDGVRALKELYGFVAAFRRGAEAILGLMSPAVGSGRCQPDEQG